jgi:hypothetical protein
MFNHAVRRRLLDANTLREGYDNVLGEVVAVDTHEALEAAARCAWSGPGSHWLIRTPESTELVTPRGWRFCVGSAAGRAGRALRALCR